MSKTSLFFLFSFMLISCSELKYSFEFVEVNTPGNSSLRAIYAVDENISWTSGSQGKIYLSQDGGKNWSQLASTAEGIPNYYNSQFQYVWKVLPNFMNQTEDEV